MINSLAKSDLLQPLSSKASNMRNVSRIYYKVAFINFIYYFNYYKVYLSWLPIIENNLNTKKEDVAQFLDDFNLNKPVICISFHLAEFKIKYPFKWLLKKTL